MEKIKLLFSLEHSIWVRYDRCVYIAYCHFDVKSLGDSPPPPELDSWFLSQGWGATLSDSENEPHDIYAIGIQVRADSGYL